MKMLALVALKPYFEPLREIILFSITLPDGKRSVNNDIDLGVLANVNITDIKNMNEVMLLNN